MYIVIYFFIFTNFFVEILNKKTMLIIVKWFSTIFTGYHVSTEFINKNGC